MCELQHCTFCQTKDGGMKQIIKDFATRYLYRIFVYEKGDVRGHDLSVRAFQDFLHQKGVQYSIRALYDYAEGRLPFPAALLPYLIEFSNDRELVSFFLPAIKGAIRKLSNRYEKKEAELKEEMSVVRQAKEGLTL